MPLVKILLLLLLLVVGYQFYRGFNSSLGRFRRDGERISRVSEDYVRTLFQSMGHLAKSDGRVSEDEIRAARLVMHRLGLNPSQVRRAMHWFAEGKEKAFPLLGRVRALLKDGIGNSRERQMFVRLLLEVVLAKSSMHRAERALIWAICNELGIGRVELAQLEAMIRAQKGFKRSPAGDADAARIRAAYRTLGIDQDATNDQVKTAYRRLMNRNHPDKLAADSPDAATIAAAEQRTREIRAAYEMLKARRSIR